MTKRVAIVVGARPQFVKAAVLSRALAAQPSPAFESILIHTGQHYDDAMSELFFRQLGVPQPNHRLEVGSASLPSQTARILERLEPVLRAENPDAVVVVGDTNSTLAAALCAAQLERPLIHVEAGERAYQRRQLPEEINRVLTDHLAHLCLTATRQAEAQLRREGIAASRIRVTGDIHYDLFRWGIGQRDLRTVGPEGFGLTPGEFILATIHRVENTENVERLLGLMRTLDGSSRPVLLPMHPRLRQRLESIGFQPRNALRLTEPLGYLDILGMLEHCRLCVTDSGGLIREAYFARKPTLVPMANVTWHEIAWTGWSIAVDQDLGRLARLMEQGVETGPHVEGLFGDGRAAERVIEAVGEFLERPGSREPWSIYGDYSPTEHSTGPRPAFTFAAYRGLLDRLREAGYRFAAFDQAEVLLREARPFVLLRHDVTLDLEQALRMARLEAEAGVAATYCVTAAGPFFNPLEREAVNQIREILSLGHRLGLHLDRAAVDKDASIGETCRRQSGFLETFFERPVDIVSFQHSDGRGFSGDPGPTTPPTHTDLPLFHETIRYLSDGDGAWRDGYPTEDAAFRARRPLHLLVHPVWYGDAPRGELETLESFVDRQSRHLRGKLAEHCAPYRLGDWRRNCW